jgi:hypothetical protein
MPWQQPILVNWTFGIFPSDWIWGSAIEDVCPNFHSLSPEQQKDLLHGGNWSDYGSVAADDIVLLFTAEELSMLYDDKDQEYRQK